MKNDKNKKPEVVHDVSASLNAPRKKHGTRVTITFVCAGCGANAQLDYKPRGVALTDLLCEECMGAKEGTDRWKLVRDKKKSETSQKMFEVTCMECGTKDTLSHPAKNGWTCMRCKLEHATPDPTRLEAMEVSEETDRPILVRRKKVDPE
jgi:ribosomal protein L37AE/L43A